MFVDFVSKISNTPPAFFLWGAAVSPNMLQVFRNTYIRLKCLAEARATLVFVDFVSKISNTPPLFSMGRLTCYKYIPTQRSNEKWLADTRAPRRIPNKTTNVFRQCRRFPQCLVRQRLRARRAGSGFYCLRRGCVRGLVVGAAENSACTSNTYI